MHWHWIPQALLAVAAYSGMILIISSQLKKGVTVTFCLFIISLIWLPTFGIWSNTQGIKWQEWKFSILWLIMAGVLSVIGNWAQFKSVAIAPNAGYAMAIVGCQAAVISILSWRFFKGEMSIYGIIGVALCTLGIIFISLPNK